MRRPDDYRIPSVDLVPRRCLAGAIGSSPVAEVRPRTVAPSRAASSRPSLRARRARRRSRRGRRRTLAGFPELPGPAWGRAISTEQVPSCRSSVAVSPLETGSREAALSVPASERKQRRVGFVARVPQNRLQGPASRRRAPLSRVVRRGSRPPCLAPSLLPRWSPSTQYAESKPGAEGGARVEGGDGRGQPILRSVCEEWRAF